jgi:hypothetical protein
MSRKDKPSLERAPGLRPKASNWWRKALAVDDLASAAADALSSDDAGVSTAVPASPARRLQPAPFVRFRLFDGAFARADGGAA